MNGLVLILLLVCGEPRAMAGWGMPVGVGPFFGTLSFIEKDEETSAGVQLLMSHPGTERMAYEVIRPEERKFKCGTGA